MKNNRKKVLSLKKIKVASLKSMYNIIGGNLTDQCNTDDTNTNTKSLFCPPKTYTCKSCPPKIETDKC